MRVTPPESFRDRFCLKNFLKFPDYKILIEPAFSNADFGFNLFSILACYRYHFMYALENIFDFDDFNFLTKNT
jgi:hypothetical protein